MQRILRRLKSQKAFTLVETVMAITLFTIMVLGGLSLMVSAVGSYNRDVNRTSLEADIGHAMRMITDELRGSVSVMVDSGGQGLSYWRPLRTGPAGDQHIAMPLQSDGVQRRIWRSGSQLLISGRTRPLIRDLAPATSSNVLFALRPSGKAVVVTLTSSMNLGTETIAASKTEVVRMRNLQ